MSKILSASEYSSRDTYASVNEDSKLVDEDEAEEVEELDDDGSIRGGVSGLLMAED